MQIYKSLNSFSHQYQGSVLVIGNFDGIHKGHKALIQKAAEAAHEKNRPAGLLTFEPHPRELFRPDDPPFRITPEKVKIRILAHSDLDFVISLPFDWDFASQSPEAFINKVLDNALAPERIIIGKDFRFGQMRKGGYTNLRKAGYKTRAIDDILSENKTPYSSSRIRSLLRHGHIKHANEQLGWEWEIEGQVFKGDQRGRELGYPTANIRLDKTIHPAYGVYASRVQIEGETLWRPAATNIGIRPMYEVETGQVEAYILDFDGDLYGKTLRVKPVQLLRGEAKFDSLESLTDQMNKDCRKTREILM